MPGTGGAWHEAAAAGRDHHDGRHDLGAGIGRSFHRPSALLKRRGHLAEMELRADGLIWSSSRSVSLPA
ncbi:MAG: hypothetical protein WDM81_00765 [Rhizomicrobium sp.]